MDNWTSLSTGLVQFIFRFILLYFVTTSIKRPKKQVFKGFFGAVVIKKSCKAKQHHELDTSNASL